MISKTANQRYFNAVYFIAKAHKHRFSHSAIKHNLDHCHECISIVVTCLIVQ